MYFLSGLHTAWHRRQSLIEHHLRGAQPLAMQHDEWNLSAVGYVAEVVILVREKMLVELHLRPTARVYILRIPFREKMLVELHSRPTACVRVHQILARAFSVFSLHHVCAYHLHRHNQRSEKTVDDSKDVLIVSP
jgi:hypothetical protein